MITDINTALSDEVIDLTLVNEITDFTDLQNKHLSHAASDALITEVANTITLLNVNIADLGADDSVFV